MPKKTIICPRCQKQLGVPVEKLGRWITCPLCQMEFAALAEEPEESTAVADDGEDDEQFEQTQPKKPLSLGAILALSLMGAAVLFGLLALIASRHPAPSDDEQAQAPEVIRPAPAPAPETMPPLAQQQPGGAMPSLDGLQSFDVANQVASTVKQVVIWTTVLSIVLLVTAVAMIIWVVRNARNRGMEGVGVWISAIFFLNFFGLLIYLAAHRKGLLVPCRHCGNQRLKNARLCPHCGNEIKKKKRPRPQY